MKKYFCISDIHSFYDPFIKALKREGFDKNNKDHILVILGDLFDRGPDSVKIYEFVRSLPEDRLVYIRGNHEDLLCSCVDSLQKNMTIANYHISNGTLSTLMQFAGIDEKYLKTIIYNCDSYYSDGIMIPTICTALRSQIVDKIKEVIDFINEKSVDYFEVNNYIMVHGWIPTESVDDASNRVGKGNVKYLKEWRNCDSIRWCKARWMNGMDAWKNGVKEANKTIICGHWHCSYGWSHIMQERPEFPEKNRKNWERSFEPFIADGIIAIDACTAYTGICNCIVLEEEQNN